MLGLLDKYVEKISSWALVTSVLMLLFISVLNIVMRWFDSSFSWIEPFVRHLVFLGTFLGGVIATGRGTHIGIDIIGKYLENQQMEKAHIWIGKIISLTSFLTLLWLINASIGFLKMEAEYGKIAFLGIHSKFLVAIIPVGFGLICYRFFYLFISSFAKKIETTTDNSSGEVQ